MDKTYRLQPEWRWKPLISLIILGSFLYFSWQYQPLRELWNSLDRAVFFTLNGSLQDAPDLQMIWGLLNNRAADVIPGLLMLALYIAYAFQNKRRHLPQRFALFIFMIFYIPIVMLLFKQFVDTDRLSPSLVLEPVYRLTELAPWTKPKDASSSSFPGDHATVLIMWTGFLAWYAGKKYGLLSLAVLLIFIQPRLVGGAHWATDVIIGGGFIASIGLAVALFTPLASNITKLLTPVSIHFLKLIRIID